MHRFIAFLIAMASTAVAASSLERVRVSDDGSHFVHGERSERFVPWGVNYDRDFKHRLLEDYWTDEWPTVESDFREMKELGANVVRIHLQLGRFMESPEEPRAAALARLTKLLELAEATGLYLDITGLGCYHKADVPKWYDPLPREERWTVQTKFWEAVPKTCAGSDAVFCYDIMNEPALPAKDKTDEWTTGQLGGKDFVQRIGLELDGMTRSEMAAD